jgi:hyaluronan synthase
MNNPNYFIRWLVISNAVFLPFALLAHFYIGRLHIVGLMSLYGLLSVGRILLQSYAARRVRNDRVKAVRLPKAAIIIAVFNEPVHIFERSLRSLVRQRYSVANTKKGLDIIVVDDGSDNGEQIKAVCRTYGVKYIYQDNAGKREALYNGFKHLGDAQVVLTADSDTVWHMFAARELVTTLMQSNVGAVTGYVAVSNAKFNLLTRLIDMRYWMAFNQERAAQSFFGAVTCVSGPLGAYRRHLIEAIKDDFLNQCFLGKVLYLRRRSAFNQPDSVERLASPLRPERRL